MMGLGLREAELARRRAEPCKRRIEEDEAEELRHELVEAGAVVEVRVHDGSAPPERAATGEASVTWGATATPSGASATNVAMAASTPIEGFGVVLNNFGVQKINVIGRSRAAHIAPMNGSRFAAERMARRREPSAVRSSSRSARTRPGEIARRRPSALIGSSFSLRSQSSSRCT